jgi:uncharacterized protein (TIGR03435 family)
VKSQFFQRLPLPAITALLLAVATAAMPVIFSVGSATAARARSQSPSTHAVGSEFKYEVASIKPRGTKPSPEYRGYMLAERPDGLSIRAATLESLIQSAYGAINGDAPLNAGLRAFPAASGLLEEQIIGAPSWANFQEFVIEAKMDPSVADELKKLGPVQQNFARDRMLQALLADRFKLATHVENRELPVYFLMLAKNVPKFKIATPGESYPKGNLAFPWQAGTVVSVLPTDPGSIKLMSLGASMTTFTETISRRLRRTIVDKTGLKGNYDFQLQWSIDEYAETGPAANWPSLFKALQEQLGLKLESGKGPVPVIVIDHAEKPSGN